MICKQHEHLLSQKQFLLIWLMWLKPRGVSSKGGWVTWGRKTSYYEVIGETPRLNTARYFPLCFRWTCRFWQAPPKSKHTIQFYKNTCSLARWEFFKHYDWKAVNLHKTWYCAKYRSKKPVCLEDNINNENPLQPVISAHIGVLFKATISLCFRSSHLVLHTCKKLQELNICSYQRAWVSLTAMLVFYAAQREHM